MATTTEKWCDWLARNGYGIDFNFDEDPPCLLADLGAAMHRLDPSETPETWAWCVTENTPAFASTKCPCGCPQEMHIGEIGCPCGMPDEPPCTPTPTTAAVVARETEED